MLALHDKENAILKSPALIGKYLALLSTVLAFQNYINFHKKIQKMKMKEFPEFSLQVEHFLNSNN
jgi:hypothetical protein